MKKTLKKFPHQKEFIERTHMIAKVVFQYAVQLVVITIVAFQLIYLAVNIVAQLYILPNLQ